MEQIALKDIADFIKTGKTPPTKMEKYFNGNIQWFTPGDLDKSKYLDRSTRTLSDLAFTDNFAVSYPKGTLLVACIGNIGKLGITVENCSSNQQLTGIKPKENVDVNYLYYWFMKNKLTLQLSANSAVVPILNNKNLGVVKVPIPPLSEQKSIADILDVADSLRQKDKQLIEHYNALSKSLFIDMFGDPITNPMGWEKKSLGDLTKLVTDGKHGDCNNDIGSGYFFISAKDIKNGIIDYSKAREIVKEEFEEVNRRTALSSGDLVMVNTGATIGKMAIAPESSKTLRTTFQKSVAVIKPKENLLSSVFLKYVFLLRINDFASKGSGSAIKNLLLSEMRRFKIIVPTLELQKQFSERIAVIEEQKKQLECGINKSEDLFNSLLQRAFKGELTS